MEIDLIKESEVNMIETIENWPNIPITPILTKQIILNAQKNDDEIRSIFERLKNLKTEEKLYFDQKTYFLHDDLLCIENTQLFKMIVIPRDIAKQVIEYIHFARDHVVHERLMWYLNKLHLFIKGKNKLASEVVGNCFFLSTVKRTERKCENKTNKYETFIGTISISVHLVRFSSIKFKNKFCSDFFDAFSLYVDCTTLENKKALTVARQIGLFVAKYGLYGQSRITSDLGQNLKLNS
jgi:hypothetical protein